MFARALGDGGSLRARLLVLVLIPLLGCGVFAVARVGSSVASARDASRADAHMRGAAAIDVARGTFEQEILPALSATVVRNPSLNAIAVPSSVLRAAAAITSRLPALRASTDVAVAALGAQPAVAGDRPRFVSELARARAGIDRPQVLSAAQGAATAFLAALARAESDQVAAAARAGVDLAGIQALRDVDLTAQAVRTATEEMGLYSGTQFPGAVATAARRQLWAEGWAAYVAASAAVAGQAAPAVAARWNAVNATPAVRSFNAYLASQLVPTEAVSLVRMIGLIVEDGLRNQAYLGVLSAALDRALTAGAEQRHRAEVELGWLLAAALTVIGLSVWVSIRVRRSITRPLDRLAAQATRISEGELTNIAVSGPREVRTVARALSDSVRSLRNIEEHAAAVAAGDLDSSAIQRRLPGPLGQVVHSSAERIIGAINEREIAQRELAHRAAHDALTELPNRPQAHALIAQALHRGQRSSTMTALMFVDLDYFKAVNDTFGHATGDAVLQVVAARVLRVVRTGDTVARLGGDEFVVLLEDVDEEAGVVILAERIVAEISGDMVLAHRTVHVGASIGIAFCRDGYVDPDRLLHEADAAAYRAKSGGRGRAEVFNDQLRTELTHRAELEQAITRGLDRSEFVLYYQPVVDLRTGRTQSLEALIRWERPGHGLLPPAEFIPVAEQSTLVNEIGRWVLREATDQLAAWDEAGAPTAHLSIAVNISGRHLTSHRLVTDVTDALTHSGIAGPRLILEMTETVLVDDLVATQNLQKLRALGVRIAIDDFGTGFTSIGQLPRLHVDTLKIDRSFVASSDSTQRELVRLIVASAHAFGLSVVAEGIEEQAQADQVKATGAEYGQGYLFARPQPGAAFFSPVMAASVTSPAARLLPDEPVHRLPE